MNSCVMRESQTKSILIPFRVYSKFCSIMSDVKGLRRVHSSSFPDYNTLLSLGLVPLPVSSENIPWFWYLQHLGVSNVNNPGFTFTTSHNYLSRSSSRDSSAIHLISVTFLNHGGRFYNPFTPVFFIILKLTR